MEASCPQTQRIKSCCPLNTVHSLLSSIEGSLDQLRYNGNRVIKTLRHAPLKPASNPGRERSPFLLQFLPRLPMKKLFPPLATLVLLQGCAAEKPLPQPPSAKPLSGEQILRESQGMAALGQRYKSGEAMTEEGERLVEEGNQKVQEGRRMMAEGRKVMQEAERGYGEIKH